MRLEAEQVTKQYQTDPKKSTVCLCPFWNRSGGGERRICRHYRKIGKRKIHAPPYPCRAASADIGLRAGGRKRFVPHGGR